MRRLKDVLGSLRRALARRQRTRKLSRDDPFLYK
jgi:hypothetical protein